MSRFWMVRAGRGGKRAGEFESLGCVAIGWLRGGDFTALDSPDEIRRRIDKAYAGDPPGKLNTSFAQTNKFRNVMGVGDRVVTYDGPRREYLIGTITGDYAFRPEDLKELPHQRAVGWIGRVPKEALRRESKNTLGGLLTIFEPGPDVLRDLEDALATNRKQAPSEEGSGAVLEELDDIFAEFYDTFLSQKAGADHAVIYLRGAEQGRENWAEVVRQEAGGADITSKVLMTLLPHTNSEAHRLNGNWIHVAPAIAGDVRTWYEGAGLAQPGEWIAKARLIFDFVQRVTSDPSELAAACADFSRSPLSKGLQCGMITPILNALQPEQFAIINSKVVGTMPGVSGVSVSSKLSDYADSNESVLQFVAANEEIFEKGRTVDMSPLATFDMMAHWYVAVREDDDASDDEDNAPPSRGRSSLDRLTSKTATEIAERICPDGAPRALAFEFLARSIAFAHSLAPNGWSVTLKERLIRLNVSAIFALDIDSEGMRVVLDRQAIRGKLATQIAAHELDSEFRYLPNAATYRVPYDELDPLLNLLRPAHEDLIRQATAKSQKATYRASHSPGVLRMLRERGYEVPDPTYALVNPPVPPAGDGHVGGGHPVNAPYSIESAASETMIASSELERWLKIINRKGQAIIYGPPGTGKTFVAERLARVLAAGGEGVVELVQFHPAYSYEDFMQGIRPASSPSGALRYDLQAGRFLDFCAKAAGRKGASILIVDEINRANLASVFGELMYLLEYRDKSIPLAGGGEFRIPANVRIIGTMNTADRSVALVDHALRRRFGFIRLDPDLQLLDRFHSKHGRDASGLIEVLGRLNAAIADPNYSVGISYFMREKLAEDLGSIWAGEVEPYIEELFFDRPAQVTEFRWAAIAERVQL